MEINDYQKQALRTARFPESEKYVYTSLGLNGEAGEVADKIKKIIRGDGGKAERNANGALIIPDDKKVDIALEIGDVLWYCAVLSHELGFDLGEVAQMNIDKLASRDKRGVIKGSGDNR